MRGKRWKRAGALRRHGAPDRQQQALRLLLPLLMAYHWPGNVRELENVVERAAVLFGDEAAGDIDAHQLGLIVPELLRGRREATAEHGLAASRRETEEAQIRRVLRECGGNRSEAARRLGIGRTTLWRKLAAQARSA